MTIKFHISNDVLLSYSAGTLDEASGLLVATHLALCPHCRARNIAADSLGGHLLDSIEPVPVSSTMRDAVLSRVKNEVFSDDARPSSPAPANAIIPDPLRTYLGGDIDGLQWKWLAPRVQQIPIPTIDQRSKARLLRFQSGLTVPLARTQRARTHPGSYGKPVRSRFRAVSRRHRRNRRTNRASAICRPGRRLHLPCSDRRSAQVQEHAGSVASAFLRNLTRRSMCFAIP